MALAIVLVIILVICIGFSNKHSNDMDQAAVEHDAAKGISAGVKSIIWTIIAIFMGFMVFVLLGTTIGLPK